jgi:MFS superfamily sulfate permease-like transporter
MTFLTRLFPFLAWFRRYSGPVLRADLIAGVTVAMVLIPQSMAYAQLAGLPAYYGLYAAFLPPMVAALFGSSHQLATGPVAVVSLMTAAALEPLATAGSAQYVQYAILLALLVGAFQLVLGLLRLGLIVNFLSHPVVNGFTNAAALIIATSQLSKVFGVSVESAEHHYETVYRVLAAALDDTHWPTLGMAVLAFAIMVGLRRVNPRIPSVLVAVVLTTILAWATGYERVERAALSQIEIPELRELVAGFNTSLAEKERLEGLRRVGRRQVEEELRAKLSTREVCTQCHQPRELGSAAPAPAPTVTSGQALTLHHLAGLLTLRVHQLGEHVASYRERIRELELEAARGPDGQPRFHRSGTLAEGQARLGGTWRLSVGGKKLDPKALTLAGGGSVVGTIPKGLPQIALPTIDWSALSQLLLMAMIISLLAFMEAISIAKAMAARTHQRLDPNQELIGQGLANLAGCVSQSYAVSGSFSRSAVNLQAGAQTGLSNVFSSGVVILVLLFFTPALYHLPQSVLAAIIMMAVIGLLNVRGFVNAWRAQWFDGLTGVVTFAVTLFFAPHLEWGIAIGVALALGYYLFRTMKPHLAELSLHPDGSLRDAKRHGLGQCKHIAAIRFDGPLNFANTSYLEEEVLKLVAEMPELKQVLIAAHGINEIDASGEEMLSHLVDRLREAGYEVSLSGLKEGVQDVLQRTALYLKIGPENMYPTQAMAVAAIHARAHVQSTEKECPLLRVVRSGLTTRS